jgi:two-component system, NarL family, sensor histidine kinase UhpB
LYGYERDEFLSLTQNDICFGRKKNNKLGENLEKHRKKDGQEMIVEFTSYSINYYGKDANQVLVNDVTRKLKLEQQIRLQKQQLVEAVLRAQESERKAIGADLHDNINQILTALQLHLGLALDYPDKRIAILKKSISSVSLAIEEIRKLSKKLIACGDLKNLGLVHSLEALIADIQPLTKAKLWLHADDLDESGLTDELKTNIYRIIQEQLNNILKYADAGCVDISLSTANRCVTLLINDDGNGFDVMAPRNGIGISNIISRAELFNGSVKIDSGPGQGCRLHVELNVKNRWNEIECHGIWEKN